MSIGGVRASETMHTFQDLEQSIKKSVDRVNNFRASKTNGTLEEHWQARKKEKTIDQMAISSYTGDKTVAQLYPKEEREAVLEKRFKESLSRQRARYNSLPKDSYHRVKVKEFDCIQWDEYERLGTPVAQYAVRTGGGLGHIRSYACFIRPNLGFAVTLDMKVANGVEFNYDEVMRRTLESLELDESLPVTATTYAKRKAAASQ